MTSQGWCYTINNLSTQEWKDSLSDKQRKALVKATQYCCMATQRAPTTQRIHIQGYIQFNTKKNMTNVKAILNAPQAHVEIQRGTAKQASDYIKNGTTNIGQAQEDGVMLELEGKANEQGKRTDLQTACQLHEEGKKAEDILKIYPHLRDRAGKMVAHWKQVESTKKPMILGVKIPIIKDKLYMMMWNWVHGDNPRKIMWIYSQAGGTGKTERMKLLSNELKDVGEKEVMYTCGGRTWDLAYTWKETQSVVLMDIARTNADAIPYEFIEQVKNGAVTSNKYESIQKIADKQVNVIITANEAPDTNKISEDRLILYCLDRNVKRRKIVPS